MSLVSLRAYAASRRSRGLPGGSLSAVQKAAKTGRITLVDGKIDPEAADAAWARNTSVEQQARGKSGGAKPQKAMAVPTGMIADGSKDQDGTAATSSDAEGYLEARARKEAAMADLAEMEAAELRGETAQVKDIVQCWGEMAAAFRARMLALPSMAAPLIAAPGKVAEAQATLRRLINEALEELSGDGVPATARARARRHQAAPETAA